MPQVFVWWPWRFDEKKDVLRCREEKGQPTSVNLRFRSSECHLPLLGASHSRVQERALSFWGAELWAASGLMHLPPQVRCLRMAAGLCVTRDQPSESWPYSASTASAPLGPLFASLLFLVPRRSFRMKFWSCLLLLGHRRRALAEALASWSASTTSRYAIRCVAESQAFTL